MSLRMLPSVAESLLPLEKYGYLKTKRTNSLDLVPSRLKFRILHWLAV